MGTSHRSTLQINVGCLRVTPGAGDRNSRRLNFKVSLFPDLHREVPRRLWTCWNSSGEHNDGSSTHLTCYGYSNNSTIPNSLFEVCLFPSNRAGSHELRRDSATKVYFLLPCFIIAGCASTDVLHNLKQPASGSSSTKENQTPIIFCSERVGEERKHGRQPRNLAAQKMLLFRQQKPSRRFVSWLLGFIFFTGRPRLRCGACRQYSPWVPRGCPDMGNLFAALPAPGCCRSSVRRRKAK